MLPGGLAGVLDRKQKRSLTLEAASQLPGAKRYPKVQRLDLSELHINTQEIARPGILYQAHTLFDIRLVEDPFIGHIQC